LNRQELEELWKDLEDENQYLNDLGAGNPRIPRKTSKPKKSKKLTGLIEKALKLVRRVEEIGERKRTIETLNKENLCAISSGTIFIEWYVQFTTVPAIFIYISS